MGLQLEHQSEPIRIIEKVVFTICAIYLVLRGYSVAGVFIAHVISSALGILIGAIVIRKKVKISNILSTTSKNFPVKEAITFNINTILFFICLTTFYHVDVLTLRFFTSETQVGYYRAALTIAGFLWVAPRAAQNVLLQSVSEHWRQGNVAQINELSGRTTRFVVLFTCLLAIGVATLADPFVPYYFGSEFTPAIIPLILLLPGTLGFAMARPFIAITQAKGNLRPLVIITAVVATINLVLNILFVPFLGIEGAAIATSIGYGLLPIGNIICARYVGYDPTTDLQMMKIVSTCVLSVPVIFVVDLMSSGWASLFIVPPAGLLVFGVLSILTGAVKRREAKSAYEYIISIKGRDIN